MKPTVLLFVSAALLAAGCGDDRPVADRSETLEESVAGEPAARLPEIRYYVIADT